MTTTTTDPASGADLEKSEAQLGANADRVGPPEPPGGRWFPSGTAAVTVIAILVVWVIARFALADRWTLALDPQELTTIHTNLNTWPDWVAQNRNSSPAQLLRLL